MKHWRIDGWGNIVTVSFHYERVVPVEYKFKNREEKRKAVRLMKEAIRLDCAKKLKGNK
jgi:hypothetical protein